MTDILNTPIHVATEPDVYTMLKDIVSAASVVYGKELFFTFGPTTEIFESLIAMGKSNVTSEKKFPMIALAGPAKIVKGDWTCYGEVTMNFIIATWSDINTKAEQRNENNYNNILRPVSTIFVQELLKCRHFDILNPEKLQYDLTDEFNAAKRMIEVNGIKLPDIIDVREINNIKLKIK